MIACKPAFPPYLAALNPTDQVFDFEELEYHYLVANRTEDVPSKDDDDDDDNDDENDDMKTEKREKNNSVEDEKSIDAISTSPQLKSPIIDNPFLKAAKASKKLKSDASVHLNF